MTVDTVPITNVWRDFSHDFWTIISTKPTNLKNIAAIFEQIEARYSYARDRAVGFSEFWQPLKWSEEEWERRTLVELGDRNSWHVQKFPASAESRTL